MGLNTNVMSNTKSGALLKDEHYVEPSTTEFIKVISAAQSFQLNLLISACFILETSDINICIPVCFFNHSDNVNSMWLGRKPNYDKKTFFL